MGFLDIKAKKTFEGYMVCYTHAMKLAVEASKQGYDPSYCNDLENLAYRWKERADKLKNDH